MPEFSQWKVLCFPPLPEFSLGRQKWHTYSTFALQYTELKCTHPKADCCREWALAPRNIDHCYQRCIDKHYLCLLYALHILSQRITVMVNKMAECAHIFWFKQRETRSVQKSEIRLLQITVYILQSTDDLLICTNNHRGQQQNLIHTHGEMK